MADGSSSRAEIELLKGNRMLQILAFVLGGLVLFVILLGIFAPKDFKLEREAVVNRSKDEVFGYLRIFRNQANWNAWSKKDPDIKREYRGTDGTVGFTSCWASEVKDVGTAEQEIKGIVEGQRIDSQIRMQKPFKASFNTYLVTVPVQEKQTKVTMGMASRMPFPVNGISFFVNVCLGKQMQLIKDMDDSLSNLKSILE